MGETISCKSSALAAPGGGPGGAGAGAGGGAGVGAAATLGCACDDAAAAGCSSPREHPGTIGIVDSRTAVARIIGSVRPSCLRSNFMIDSPRRRLTAVRVAFLGPRQLLSDCYGGPAVTRTRASRRALIEVGDLRRDLSAQYRQIVAERDRCSCFPGRNRRIGRRFRCIQVLAADPVLYDPSGVHLRLAVGAGFEPLHVDSDLVVDLGFSRPRILFDFAIVQQ